MAQPFRNRTRELARLEQFWNGAAARFLTVAGRRRVGKSRLLTHFLEQRPHVLLTGTQETASAQLRDATAALRRATGDPLLAAQTLANWDALLAYVAQRARSERFALVLDEFSLFAEATPGLESLIQRWWDHDGQLGAVMLVIADSSLAFMDRLAAGDQPLFGRPTHRLALQPLDYWEAAAFYQAYDPLDRMRAYAVFGGMPAYLADLDPDAPLAENVLRLVFSRSSALRDEPDYLFAQERSIREPRGYRSVLRAMAEGNTQPNAMAQAAGFRTPQEIAEILKRLQDLGLAERIVPAGAPAEGRISRYLVTDPFLAFWFRFVAPARDLIAADAGHLVVDDLFAQDSLALDAFVSRAQGPWERACAAYLWRLQRTGSPIVPRFDALGCWWQNRGADQSAELDVVGLRGRRPCLVGSARWRREFMKPSDLDALRVTSRLLGAGASEAAEFLFSRSGFDPHLVTRAAAEGAQLVSVADMYAPDLA